MSEKIRQYLAKEKYDTPSDETYSRISEWLEWYQNDVEKFHKYKIYNGVSVTTHDRYRLGMAKKVCEDWANLLLNEKVAIKAGNFNKRLQEILERNNFRTRGNQLIEKAFALGTGAFVEYKNAENQPEIDYIRADLIYPLSWENGDITECAFGSYEVSGGKEYIYLQIHRKGHKEGEDPTLYYIENKYIDKESGDEMELPEDLLPIVQTTYNRPLFQIISPNMCNNVELDSPLGISVYANSIDQLKGCDLVYDSYMNEFVLGRKRILVPLTMAKMTMQKDGTTTPTFDPKDEVFYQIEGDRNSDQKLTEVDFKIRASEHELGIQRNLDILAFKCGMGTGRYKFDASSGVKTATEVISDKSDLYQNRQKNAIIVRNAVIAMVKAIAFLETGSEVEVTIDFDDSIIEDVNATIDKNIKLVNSGLRSKVTAIMEINKCTEAEALKELKRISEDNQITGQDIDWTKSDGDNDETDEEDEKKKEKTGQDADEAEEEEQE